MTKLNAGDCVFHPARREWGVGKILTVGAEAAEVFFVNAGHRKLLLTHVTLEPATGDEARSGLLENLSAGTYASDAKFIPLPLAIQKFLTNYPGGFHGERFAQEERIYKDHAHKLATELLAESVLRELFAAGKYAEICTRARKCESATKMLASFEAIKLNDALKNPAFQRVFAEAMIDNLYSSLAPRERFERFASALSEVGVPKWPIVTYYGFIVFPEREIFIKPEVTQNAARICGWEVSYSPELTWNTYSRVAGLFEYLSKKLCEADMAPRDMIDVQSFVWCIAEH